MLIQPLGLHRPVLTKRDFVQRYIKGEFGNKGPVWDTYEDYKASGYQGLVHIRNRVAGGQTWYNVPNDQVWAEYAIALGLGIKPDSLYFAGMAPHQYNLMQGEVQETYKGLSLFYSTVVGKPMRDALAERARQVYGVEAVCLLKHYMDNNSYEWLQLLLERYEGHVVEFSTFSVCWGTIPRFNTVYWEVRGGY